MRLRKAGYCADFVMYPGLVITAVIVAVRHNSGHEMSLWLLAAIVGSMLWTLAEYVLHRFVLHRIAPFASMHDAHHQAPLAFVGTPTWLSLSVILGAVFAPAWVLGSFNIACGLTVGAMAGFLWYGVAHHAIHHRAPRMIANRLLIATRRHARHHYSREGGNFGVTTAFWDHVFGTTLNATSGLRPICRRARPASRHPGVHRPRD
jgi:sterol desaturase/sphingolipid hydroxylase (fatty acid hydroxylase superfamily)